MPQSTFRQRQQYHLQNMLPSQNEVGEQEFHSLLTLSSKKVNEKSNTGRKTIELASISRDTDVTVDVNSVDTCEVGLNIVEECRTIQGTESKLSAATNLAKCINGAGSFALPYVFLNEGIIGGTLALLTCGTLATYTMQLLLDMKLATNSSSYVELARKTLGNQAANLVFALTISASLGVCSTYVVFMGQTLDSLSCDATSTNLIRQYFPDVATVTWEIIGSALVFPLTLLRSYGIFAFTSALGVVAVLGGILVTLSSGIFVQPGGGILYAFQQVANQPMFPDSLAAAFGSSFGTVAYLFCVNFLTFPIMNSMKVPEEYKEAVPYAVSATAIFNTIFAALCVGFYGNDTADLVLANLENGSFLSALKILLCVDLLFTFPIVFSSGRQILENTIIGTEENNDVNADQNNIIRLKRAGIAGGGVLTCLSLAQIGGFGTVANLIGGVAQGTLAFILPPLIAVLIARRDDTFNDKPFALDDRGGEIPQVALGLFGAFVVLSTSYFTAVSVFS